MQTSTCVDAALKLQKKSLFLGISRKTVPENENMPEIRQSEKVGTVGIKFVFRFRLFRFSVKQVASQVASLDIGYKAGVAEVRNSKPKVLFLLGADEETVTRSDLPKNSFVVYIGNNSKGSDKSLYCTKMMTNTVCNI